MYAIFLDDKLPVSLYATEWFMTLFTMNFPFEWLDHIFDLVILNGLKMVHQIALLEISHKSDIVDIPSDQRLMYLKQDKHQRHTGHDLQSYLGQLATLKVSNKLLRQL